ncbi:AMP-dependent synthetase/ligase [Hoyosella subflava]|uniref:Acyl-CoA synthetase n=1 Tax=Hoyosella subflava (strain DSM 45089 / JCM 17490 / NBRC 109087 / DQS3-9A1) TaxID=443218 RepID=F6EL90_HOYSD|nr:long-chain fatty acid--CoA ligase [Hoyosella subflava]AEF39182.1 AMP-dependent synthetase and ligase [Hoyosella subflava DQS3-9A1]
MTKTRSSQARTLCEAFQNTVRDYSSRIAVRTPGGATTLTWGQYGERVRAIAAQLHSIGVRHGDTVALMMTNRPEFHLVDTAAQHLGAIPFSIYNTSSPDQIRYLFGDAENAVVVCEAAFAPVLVDGARGTGVKHIVCIDGAPAGTVALEDIPLSEFDFERAWRSVTPDDVLTLIYTSGTTGSPKGVELTHKGMLAQVDGSELLMGVTADDRVISFLPSAHVADRWSAHYIQTVCGNQVTCVANPKEVVGALADVRPTFFGAVPTVWQKIRVALLAAVEGEQSPVKKRLGTWALSVGQEMAGVKGAGGRPGRLLAAQYALADKLVLSKIRHKIGLDQTRVALSGAAPIAPEVIKFFIGLGIPLSDAWGMSELSGLSTMSHSGQVRLGTVGKPAPGVYAKLADDGELLISGPILMRGYRNRPEQTAEAIDSDGWLHTGDIASIDSDGYISIVDRKKEIIINAGGKNMSPANIENAVKAACPLISQVVVIGNDRKYNVALVVLDEEAAAAFAKQRGITSELSELVASPELRETIDAAVATANSGLSRVEQIKRYSVLSEYWEPGSEMLTPTMKLRRKPIDALYAAEIEALYNEATARV